MRRSTRPACGISATRVFSSPCRCCCASLDEEANLSAIGRYGQFTRIVDLLVNRLRIEDWLQRYPEILDERIAPPVVIAGLMRTGTTMLHRLMACDRRFYAPLWYEARYPAPLPGYDFEGEDTRIPVAKEEVRQMIEASPDLAAIHPLEACAADEDIMLLEHSFYSTVPESFAHLPGYARWLEAHDNTPGYRYLHRLLQFLQWQKKRKGHSADRWLLKTPHHLHHLDILLEVFPGATVIQTHRDPLQTIPSLCSMNYALAGMGSDAVMRGRWDVTGATSLRAVSSARSRCVRSTRTSSLMCCMRIPRATRCGTVERIYGRLGIALDEHTRAAMAQWLQDNRREDRDPHLYTLEQFGFTRQGLERDFADYRSTFLA